MITDHWVIVQIIGQLSTLLIFTAAFAPAIKILRHWDENSSDNRQLQLERKTYLVSVILHYTLFFQFVLLLLFVEIVNSHLPALISGAMCAKGTLGVNAYGFPALYIKIIAIVFYAVFLFLNYLDQAEPYFPLTPAKYKMMPLLFLLIAADLVITIQYFRLIKADIIATCCSISFSSSLADIGQGASGSIMQFHPLVLYYVITVILLILLFYKYNYLKWLFAASVVYIFMAVTVLKEHFVRYIYARPTHNCLFDIFWREYYYVGYVLYGMLLLLLIAVIFMNILVETRVKLKKNYKHLNEKLRYTAIMFLLMFNLIIHLYWIHWIAVN